MFLILGLNENEMNKVNMEIQNALNKELKTVIGSSEVVRNHNTNETRQEILDSKHTKALESYLPKHPNLDIEDGQKHFETQNNDDALGLRNHESNEFIILSNSLPFDQGQVLINKTANCSTVEQNTIRQLPFNDLLQSGTNNLAIDVNRNVEKLESLTTNEALKQEELIDELIYHCEFCGDTFENISYKVIHLKDIHFKEKVFIC